jgi:hypothetical protein
VGKPLEREPLSQQGFKRLDLFGGHHHIQVQADQGLRMGIYSLTADNTILYAVGFQAVDKGPQESRSVSHYGSPKL